MRRPTLNFIVDLTAFVCLLLLAVTGVIIKYILPPGTGGSGAQIHGGGQSLNIKSLFGMTRHEWGDIHFYIAAAFVGLMVVHLVLHWRWIKGYVQSFSAGRARPGQPREGQ